MAANSKRKKWTESEWVKECTYISETVQAFKRSPETALSQFNNDTECFKRYCTMQKDHAESDGFFDSAEYIQSCIDDVDYFLESLPRVCKELAEQFRNGNKGYVHTKLKNLLGFDAMAHCLCIMKELSEEEKNSFARFVLNRSGDSAE